MNCGGYKIIKTKCRKSGNLKKKISKKNYDGNETKKFFFQQEKCNHRMSQCCIVLFVWFDIYMVSYITKTSTVAAKTTI